MYKIKLNHIIIICLVIFASCRSSEESKDIAPIAYSADSQNFTGTDPDLLNYWNLFTADKDGILKLEDNHVINDQGIETPGSQRVSGIVYGQTGGSPIVWGEMFIGDISLDANPDHGNRYEPEDLYNTQIGNELFGQQITFQLSDPNGQMDVQHQMYVPEKIRISNPAQSELTLASGSTITWNEDPNMNNKIILLLEYSPKSFGNEALDESGFDEEIIVPQAIPDNGSYILTDQDLSPFPSGATIELTLIRGSLEIVDGQHSGKSYKVAGYSHELLRFKID
jgi:hypothetical protein